MFSAEVDLVLQEKDLSLDLLGIFNLRIDGHQ